MSDQKEIWYPWSGKGEPPKNAAAFMRANGDQFLHRPEHSDIIIGWQWDAVTFDRQRIVAYTFFERRLSKA